MYCADCGHAVKQDARFCADCGAPVAVPQAPPPAAPAPAPVAPPPTAAPTPAPGVPPRRRRTWRVALAAVLSLVLATLAGWAATALVPTGTHEAQADGVVQDVEPTPEDDVVAAAGEDVTTEEGSDESAPPDDSTTSFLTSCGKVLDVVPTEAVSTRTAVAVTLEFRPVCPEGEWISSSEFRVALSDVNGVPMTDATFDLSEKPLLVPGYGDPASYLVAEYDSGTAWVAPASMESAIADGLVVVECEPRDGAKGEPVGSDPVTEEVTVTVRSGEAEREGSRRTALAALRRQVRADDAEVSDLEGAWVPQLSSKTKGTFDEYDGKTYDLADIYQQYLSLRLEYPNVRLLSSSEWGSYTLDGYWVVIAGVPFAKPNQALGWCRDRGIDESQCYAKKLERDGGPDDTTRHRG